MRHRVRNIVFIGVIILLQLLRRVSVELIRFFDSLFEIVGVYKLEFLALGISAISNFPSVSQDIGLSLLVGLFYYFLIFPHIKTVFHENLFDQLDSQRKRTIFKIVVSVHVLIGYLYVLLFTFRDSFGTAFMITRYYGFSNFVYIHAFFVIYWVMFIPLTTSFLLTYSEDGIDAQPTTSDMTFQFLSTSPGNLYDITAFSSRHYWYFVGWTYGGILLLFGAGIFWLQQTTPFAELLLIISVLSQVEPFRHLLPNRLQNLDLETRVAEVLKYGTYNIRALSHTILIFGGLLASLFITKQTYQLIWIVGTPSSLIELFYIRIAQLGVFVAASIFFISSLAGWLSLSNRVPHFVSAWVTQSRLLDKRFEPAADDVPRRSILDMEFATVFLLLTLILPFSTVGVFRWSFLFIWPIVAYIVIKRSLSISKPSPEPTLDGSTTLGYSLSFILIFLVMRQQQFPFAFLGHFDFGWNTAISYLSGCTGVLLLFSMPYLSERFDIDPNINFKIEKEEPSERKSEVLKRMAVYFSLILFIIIVIYILFSVVFYVGVVAATWYGLSIIGGYVIDSKYFEDTETYSLSDILFKIWGIIGLVGMAAVLVLL